MKRIFTILLATLSTLITFAQSIADFKNPPAELCNHVILGWDGEINAQTIEKDLDEIQAKGFRNVIVEAGYRMGAPYLSDQWFQNIRLMADGARKRGMKMWIIDEGKYPSGMAGGKFSKERPDLCMQALVRDGDGVRMVRRSSQTRCVNNLTGGKDENNSLCDYLDTLAVDQYIQWTHEQYKKTLGDHLGTTVLGFRGDEPAFQRVPWTTDILEIFKQEKGYDVKPYLPYFLGSERTSVKDVALNDEQRQAKADYWDVWSRLFADHYFKRQADWCALNGVQHITHMDKDDMLPWCMKMEGDPFRCLNRVQVPGIDVIWSQIWYNSQTEFPRLASSVAHVYGKSRAFSESFAAYTRPLTVKDAKFVIDYQLARGINFFEFMFWMSKQGPRGYMQEPGMKALNEYANRAVYMMQQGKPAARIAIYAPIPTLWLGNNEANDYMKAAAHQLTRHQRDYDFITDDGIVEAVTVGNGVLRNKSGQQYHTLIIPSSDVITCKAWTKIEEFISRGGKVLFWGNKPKAVAGKNFQDLKDLQIPTAVFHQSDSTWTEEVEKALPIPEIQLQGTRDKEQVFNDSIVYTARRLDDGMLYFIFNEGGKTEQLQIAFDQMGTVEQWDAATGEKKALPFKVNGNNTVLSLTLAPYEAKMIRIQKRTTAYNIKNYPSIQATIDAAHQDGGGTVVIPKGDYPTGALFFPRGVDLELQKGATLISKVDTTAFPLITSRFEGRIAKVRAAILNFDNNERCRVFGEGTIDAKGLEWKKMPYNRYGRPKTICFNKCHGGSIKDLHVRDQAFWCVHVLFTNGFTIDGIDIRASDYIPSSDGIDIDSSTDVNVRNTFICAYDDCISIKSGRDTDGRRLHQMSSDIVVEDCDFGYGHGGVAIGSEVSGDVKRVVVRRCKMSGENWNPIRFKSQPSRGGIVEDITFEDIDISKARNIFEINMTWRMKGADEPPYHPMTRLRHLTFRNIRGNATNGGNIIGFEEQPIGKDVITFENCHIQVEQPLNIKYAEVDMQGLEQNIINKQL